jgi:undecaprenyl-diphosphatase
MVFRLCRVAGFLLCPCLVWGAGGPLGIDHRWNYDDRGLWRRSYQVGLEDGVILLEVVGAFSTQGDTRLGLTFRRSIDSTVLTALSTEVLKLSIQRARPDQGDNPDLWFKGHTYQSFPSGEVALQASFVTPFIAEYHDDHPWVWALEALPAYDSLARMKAQAHWQTDVLAGWALGTALGIYSHHRESPLIFGLLPHGFSATYRAKW